MLSTAVDVMVFYLIILKILNFKKHNNNCHNKNCLGLLLFLPFVNDQNEWENAAFASIRLHFFNKRSPV